MNRILVALIVFVSVVLALGYFVNLGIIDGMIANVITGTFFVMAYIFIKDSDQNMTKYNYPL